MRYVLSFPVSTIIVGVSKGPEIDENVRIAATFQPRPQEEMAMLEDLTRPYYAAAAYFRRQG
jgi:predicted aldo/keto reductase-like oxidoreductase